MAWLHEWRLLEGVGSEKWWQRALRNRLGRWMSRVWTYLYSIQLFTKRHLCKGCLNNQVEKVIQPGWSTSLPSSPSSWAMWPGHRLKLCISSTAKISAGSYGCRLPHLPKSEMETVFTIWHHSLENQPDTWWQLDYIGIPLMKGQQFVLTSIDLLWVWISLLCPWCFCRTVIPELTECLCYYHNVAST